MGQEVAAILWDVTYRTASHVCIPLLCAIPLLAGCVDRRITITSEPTGARVFLNDAEVGSTPCEVGFTYFGVYDVRLHKDGYEPLVTRATAKAPFHELPGVDLAAMVVPVTKRTRIDWHFTLSPAATDEAGLLMRAAEVRGLMAEGEVGHADPGGSAPADAPGAASADPKAGAAAPTNEPAPAPPKP